MYALLKPPIETQPTLPYTPLPASINKDLVQIKTLLKEWTTTFDRFLAGENPHPSPVAIEILQIQQLAAFIRISTHFYRDQLAYDAFTADFTQIINLASSVATKLLTDCNSPVLTFSFEVGIIQPLYFTACHCRNRIMRRKAIGLLEKTGIEGLWIGKAMAAAARWVVSHEDGEGDAQEDDDFVPEMRRLRGVDMTINRQTKRMRLASSRRDRDGVVSYVSGNVGWGESAAVEVEDSAGLAAWVAELRRHREGSSP
jgi:hypothetical protein